LGAAPDSQIAEHARTSGLCLITGDWGFADIRHFPPADYAGIVVVGLHDGATGAEILAVLTTLLEASAIVAQLKGRLAIVEKGRIRVRPAF
jgi:hypothetical protein